jgi:hypothetical protein
MTVGYGRHIALPVRVPWQPPYGKNTEKQEKYTTKALLPSHTTLSLT